MTKKQIEQFNRMRATLIKISKGYQTPAQLLRDSEKDYGLGYADALEMAYENIQGEAAFAVRSVREIKPKETNANNRTIESGN